MWLMCLCEGENCTLHTVLPWLSLHTHHNTEMGPKSVPELLKLLNLGPTLVKQIGGILGRHLQGKIRVFAVRWRFGKMPLNPNCVPEFLWIFVTSFSGGFLGFSTWEFSQAQDMVPASNNLDFLDRTSEYHTSKVYSPWIDWMKKSLPFQGITVFGFSILSYLHFTMEFLQRWVFVLGLRGLREI